MHMQSAASRGSVPTLLNEGRDASAVEGAREADEEIKAVREIANSKAKGLGQPVRSQKALADLEVVLRETRVPAPAPTPAPTPEPYVSDMNM